MEDNVISLSDSSHKSDENEKIKPQELICNFLKMKDLIEYNQNDLEILEVNYNHNLGNENVKEKQWNDSDFLKLNISKYNSIIENTKEKEWGNFHFPEVNFDYKNNFKKNKKGEFESDSDCGLNDNWIQCIKNQINVRFPSNEKKGRNENDNKKKGRKNVNKSKSSDEEKKKQQKFQQNKIKKQEEISKQKAIKRLYSKNKLNINPKYSIKLMEIIFDEKIKYYDFFTDFLKYAQENNIKYSIQSQLVPKCISWNRNIEKNYINQKNEVCSNVQTMNESHIIIIWSCEEIVKHIFNDTFISAITNIKLLVPDKKLTLIIYKIECYFKYLKSIKDQTVQEEILGSLSNKKQKKKKTTLEKYFSGYPIISKKKFEKCLVEIQLIYNVNSRLIENPTEMLLCIYQYTKSLALLPSKIEKKSESYKFDWYVNCDNRDTVKVDKDGYGLKRLWQQQLCQFTLMSLEVSEAISSVYKSPLHLMETYKNCTQDEGEVLLKDIPIRRAAGPLTSVRKIGPELSKKIFIMFTSNDGEVFLND